MDSTGKLSHLDLLYKDEVYHQDPPHLFDSTPWFYRPSAFSQAIASTSTDHLEGHSCWSNFASCFVHQSSLVMRSSLDPRPSFWAVYYESLYWSEKCRLRSPRTGIVLTILAASRRTLTYELRWGDQDSRSACSGLLEFSWLTRCMSGWSLRRPDHLRPMAGKRETSCHALWLSCSG